MSRRIPLVATLVVLAAVAVMIGLGVWQGFYRLPQKEALAARYEQAQSMSADVALPGDRTAREQVWFRHTTFDCYARGQSRPMAGHNQAGETGWAHWAQCPEANGGAVSVNLGWSRNPDPVDYAIGAVGGVIAPDGPDGAARVVADLPLAGLEASARPDPRDIPNNHLSYAVQWFLFAATALVIYVLALRKRLADKGPPG